MYTVVWFLEKSVLFKNLTEGMFMYKTGGFIGNKIFLPSPCWIAFESLKRYRNKPLTFGIILSICPHILLGLLPTTYQ